MSAATTQSLVLSSPSSSSSSTSLCLQTKHHRHYRRRQLVAVKASKSIGKSSFGERKDKSNDKGLLAVSTSLLVLSSQSAFFQAFAEEASSSSSGDISPFAGVVDIAALGLLGVLAYLGNKKSSENVQVERQKTITNMPSRERRTPPPKSK